MCACGIGLGYLSKQIKKWMNGNGSRSLDNRLIFNLTGYAFKVVCQMVPLVLWRAMWIQHDKEMQTIQQLQENGEPLNGQIFLPSLIFCVLFCLHMYFRRMWCVLWSSNITTEDEIDCMKQNARLGGNLAYHFVSPLVCDHILISCVVYGLWCGHSLHMLIL